MGYWKRKNIDITEELAKSYSKKLLADGHILICNSNLMIAIQDSVHDKVWGWDTYNIDPFERRALFAEGEAIKRLNLVHTDGGIFEGEAEEALLFLLS
jgi:hypothetical protein